MPFPPLSFRAFAAVAVLLPCLGWLVHHDLGHEGDLRFFHQWALAFREGGAFYRDGPGVNYPILGALLVCAPSNLVTHVTGGESSFETFRFVHKAVLVFGEVMLVFAASRLAREAGAQHPRWLALGLAVLPSTWAGGAWFGQTDVYGTVALLVSAEGLLSYRTSGTTRDFMRGALSLHAAFLLKQLTWFAIPPLFVLLLTGLWSRQRRWHVVAAVASVGLWFAADPFLSLPDGHVSHLVFVVARSAGDHGSLLVANGASVWVLLRASGLEAGDPWLGPLTPFHVGWIVWGLTVAAWTGAGLRSEGGLELVVAAGVASLAMALFMTGVHERYLAHAIPLLFLSTAGRARIGVALLGTVAGGFVLSSVHPELVWVGRPEPVVFVAFVLLGLMAVPIWEKMRSGRSCV